MQDPFDTVDAPEVEIGQTAAAEPTPKQIGRYRVERLVGTGGFGVVYLAHDEQLQRLVAIKVPHRQLVAQATDFEAYLTEARTVANLDHRNIVPVYDVGNTTEFPFFIVSKYIDGTDLAGRLKQSRLSLFEVAELVATVAEALHYAHTQGLVHRDVKPGNILLDKSGRPFVGDFGLALREKDVGKGPRFAGTPAYMSPEQARGEGHRVDGRSDIFSLGVVFYELLVARRPFRADSQEDLLEQIVSVDVRPTRQIDDAIPKELDRICLKALSKRASERFSAAKDMAEDLRHYLAGASLAEKSTRTNPAMSQTDIATPVPTPTTAPASDTQLAKVVPKGLRSFDASDADFFLELLPGPRDRNGLPDGIRFWKTRIEATDADSTFAVGLMYGPSGCGKSSLAKAGLLPRLAKSVIVVYVEATAEDTEARLLKGLRRQLPELPENLGLIESLATVRRGRFLQSGLKVLLVLDQFEQWLHAKRNEENTELVQALRHCDGGRLQCLVLVRDDFWLAVSRFMQALEIRVVEGENARLVDLFDPRHARKVLASFGRALGALPEGRLSKEQDGFLDKAIAGLAQEGKIISVRLALFAEMVKDKPWTPATLKEVGGTEGVGVTFLEETFAAKAAPPQHRLHQKAIQAVLQALLPEAGTDIKGHMRSQQQLLEASGYAGRPRDFDELIRILDSEIRLITPTDPEGVASGEGRGAREAASDASPSLDTPISPLVHRYYQLTHDYLVPSLRDWLTRKQKETRRGRAELLLADRAAVWNARAENRQLPSLLQWVQIRRLTAKKNWTRPQRKMMGKAGRIYAWRGVAVVVTMALLGWGVYEAFGTLEAHALRDRLLDANTADVPTIVKDMDFYRGWINPLLRSSLQEAGANGDGRKQLHASLALLPVDPSQVDYLYSRLLDAQPQEVAVIGAALAPHKDALLDKLWVIVESADTGKQRLRAASMLANYDPTSAKWATASNIVVRDLVRENPIYLGHWSEAFRPVRQRLLAPLSTIFADRDAEKAAERMLATNLLATYAADDPQALADLVMDANPKQFALLFPKLREHGDLGRPVLLSEIDKQVQVAVTEHKVVLDSKGVIADDDAKIKGMAAKRYEVRFQAGKNYWLTMDSTELDSYLVLQDKAGKELTWDDDGGDGLNARLNYFAPIDDTYVVFAASFKGTGSFQLRVVEAISEAAADKFAKQQANKDKLAKRQANAAVALFKMNQQDQVWLMLKHSPDPRVRSYLIHRLGPLGADAGAIIKRLDQEPDVTIRRALILSLGDFAEREIAVEDRQLVTTKLQAIYRTDGDPGLHAAAEWLLRTWKHEPWLKQVNEEWAKERKRRDNAIRAALAPEAKSQWYVNGQGQTMVVFPGPVEFVMGSPGEADPYGREAQHTRRIGRTFAIAAKAVTMEQYRQFYPRYKQAASFHWTAGLPVAGTSWYDAASYCNWLSAREGIAKEEWCYETTPAGQTGPTVVVVSLRTNYLRLRGYRLPTEAEMEYATRAGAVTQRYYGETEELLEKYAWYVKNSQDKTWPVGSLKPNDFGLFDMLGNTHTWCQEGFDSYPRRAGAVEDKEDFLVIAVARNRSMRGSAWGYVASLVRSAHRTDHPPLTRWANFGFRPARTVAP